MTKEIRNLVGKISAIPSAVGAVAFVQDFALVPEGYVNDLVVKPLPFSPKEKRTASSFRGACSRPFSANDNAWFDSLKEEVDAIAYPSSFGFGK